MESVAFPSPSQQTASAISLPGWRKSAARLAAELLCTISPSAADEILDLRSVLLDFNASAETLLSLFLVAKTKLEKDHYLLFYRLRRVLEPSLGMRTKPDGPVQPIDFHTRSVAQLKRLAQTAEYEHDLKLQSPGDAEVSIEWRLPPVLQSISL